jgi:hypothetical protein
MYIKHSSIGVIVPISNLQRVMFVPILMFNFICPLIAQDTSGQKPIEQSKSTKPESDPSLNQSLPLSPGQKFKLAAKSTFKPYKMAWYGMGAGISQYKNDNASYGQGTAGFGKRFAMEFADGTMRNFMVRAVFPSLLHQDPRYYPATTGGFIRRSYYAVSRVLITRGDNGKQQANLSEWMGGLATATIATYTYHPKDERGARTVGTDFGIAIAGHAGGFLWGEFHHDILKKFRHKNVKTDVTVSPALSPQQK